MNEEALKNTVARNLAYYRRMAGHTQFDLAEKLSYSDKSISKWERAEGLPDVVVLARIAELYGITVNDLLSPDPPEPQKHHPTRMLIVLLSVGLVWLVATVAFFALYVAAPGASRLWLAFIFALPVSCILLIVFTALWWGILAQAVSVSALIWTLALCIHLSMRLSGMSLIYVVAAVVQVLAVLWYILRARSAMTKK